MRDHLEDNKVIAYLDDRKAGKVTIPAHVTQNADKMQVWLIGENQYGRLKERQDLQVAD